MPDRATLVRWLHNAVSDPPQRTIRRAARLAARSVQLRWDRRRDLHRGTWATASEAPAQLRSWLQGLGAPGEPDALRTQLDAAAALVVRHEFDLLGTGLVHVERGMTCPGIRDVRFPPGPSSRPDPDGQWLAGIVPRSSLQGSQAIWRLVQKTYVPIDWQLDVRSGFRWSERSWSRDISYGSTRGADIKVPWELGRMQHLPALGLLATVDSASRDRLAAEFRNEILDFVATNPPRFGVNWVTTMEVAIRIVNWLVAYDLMHLAGVGFDPSFEAIFRRSVLEHGRHIVSNLEWAPIGRGNHYLADVVGLAFVAAWLPPTPESTRWWARARNEIISEARRQLQDDGTGFEASTCYHRLTAEMLTWATALIYRADGPEAVPGWLVARLVRAAQFTIDVTKDSGLVAQIGDNDSGRFLTFLPAAPLDHRGLPALIGALTGRQDLRAFGAPFAVEGAVLASLAGAMIAAAPNPPARFALEKPFTALAGVSTSRVTVPVGTGALRDTVMSAYPDFGLYVYRSKRVFLAVRCGSVGQDGIGGHAHNDQLAIELAVDGEDWLRDPGTYVYTPFPELRNAYRSAGAHAVPRLGSREPGSLDEGLFVLGRPSVGRCLAADPRRFVGEIHVGTATLRLTLLIEDDQLLLDYETAGASPDPRLATGEWRALAPTLQFSPGYGLLA